MRTNGRKEVAEAVLIAALSALVSGLVTWGFEEAKKRLAAADAKKTAETKPAEEEETK